MNIKSLYLLGILAISTGICGDNPANNMIGSNNGNGVINASNNLIGVAPQENHVANVNNIQGNNLGQQNTIDLPNGITWPNTNDAGQLTVLQSIREMLHEVMSSPYATSCLCLAVACLRQILHLPNNEQLQPLQFITETLHRIIDSPDATDNLFKVALVLLCAQNIFTNPVEALLSQVSPYVNDEQQLQQLRYLLLDSNNA